MRYVLDFFEKHLDILTGTTECQLRTCFTGAENLQGTFRVPTEDPLGNLVPRVCLLPALGGGKMRDPGKEVAA